MPASSARRIEINRAKFDEITLAVADGMFELAKSIVLSAHPPDAPPYGQGLVQGGGVVAFAGNKRVGVAATGGQGAITKPRAAKLDPTGITVIGGFGFPGRFLEEGTVHTRAQPFLTPALMSGVSGAEPFIKAACAKRGITTKR